MRNIYLHGRLGKTFGRKFRFNADTPGKAIRLLNANFPGFERELRKGWYQLIIGDRQTGEPWGLDELEMNLGRADFHLVPVAAGSRGPSSRGKGGVLKAVLGVALVGAAIFFSGGTLAAPLGGLGAAVPGLGGAVTFGHMAGIGLASALMGVSQIISPQTPSTTGSDRADSYALNGPTNIQEQGFPVPIVIGEGIFGGIPISVGYDVEDIPVGA